MDAVSYAKASSAYKLATLVNNELVNKVDVKGSSILVPIGTTATRPVLGADEAALRHNSDTERIEEWTGTEWKNLSVSISAATLKGKDTEANILAKVDMVAEDLWIAIDTLDGWIYDGSAWINVGPLKGDKGDTGTSITQISFTSTNHISGLPAQSGGEDLYTIDYSDGSLDSFAVYNGLDSDFSSTSVATITNKVIDSETNTIGANHVHFRVRNLTANPILKGTVVKASAIQSGIDFINVEPTSSTEDRGLGIVSKTIGSNQEGLIINTGSILGINTSMWEVGKVLYTSINGTLTDVKPKGTLYQPSAYVRRSHSTLGELSVEFSEPRENKDGNLNTNSVVMAIVFGS